MYYNGDGVEQDKEQAEYWYTKAAEQGDISVQFDLALMYCIGDGVEQDKEKALSLFAKVAEQGDAKAQHNLAFMYSQGEGVKQDKAKAVYWYDSDTGEYDEQFPGILRHVGTELEQHCDLQGEY